MGLRPLVRELAGVRVALRTLGSLAHDVELVLVSVLRPGDEPGPVAGLRVLQEERGVVTRVAVEVSRDVDPPRAAAQSTYKGQTYYFCAVSCKQRFDREPDKYVKA